MKMYGEISIKFGFDSKNISKKKLEKIADKMAELLKKETGLEGHSDIDYDEDED